jgi:hypothetical protein
MLRLVNPDMHKQAKAQSNCARNCRAPACAVRRSPQVFRAEEPVEQRLATLRAASPAMVSCNMQVNGSTRGIARPSCVLYSLRNHGNAPPGHGRWLPFDRRFLIARTFFVEARLLDSRTRPNHYLRPGFRTRGTRRSGGLRKLQDFPPAPSCASNETATHKPEGEQC